MRSPLRRLLGSLIDPVHYSVRRRYLDRDLSESSSAISGRVLEIGCGRTGRRGRFQPPVGEVTDWVFVDRDVDRRPGICADMVSLPFAAQTFDTIVCLEVLEYVWKPPAALVEMRRVLKPAGTLLLSTPFLHRVDAPTDYWRFTEPALQRLLTEAGFEVIRFHSQGAALAVAVGIVRFAVSVQSRWVLRALSVALRPLFAVGLWADPAMTRRRPVLANFTTGYLFMARRLKDQACPPGAPPVGHGLGSQDPPR